MTSQRPDPPAVELDVEYLEAVLRVTQSERLKVVVRELLREARPKTTSPGPAAGE